MIKYSNLSLSFKNRIAFNYIISSSILISVVFIVVYQIVKFSIYRHINEEINSEVVKHLNDVNIDLNDTYLIQVDQWRAREHNTVDVNPVFVEFLDKDKLLIDKSPNLKRLNLKLYEGMDYVFIDTRLGNTPIRQIQTPIKDHNKTIGYLIVGMSLSDTDLILILQNTLLILFPLTLMLLFLIARFFAGRSIKPIITITETSSKISRDNLKTRILLPVNKDELYILSETINSLLDRIENAVEREKQFTSDASHELRTPLAIIKGTLEVLIRKPREKKEYEDKIIFCITEVNRLNHLADQLLLLARFENQKQNIQNESVYLNSLILDALTRFSGKMKLKNIKVKTFFSEDFYVNSDNYLLSIIISNLLSNAIKYSKDNTEITILLEVKNEKIICFISDKGIGISNNDLDKVFNSFYRTNSSNSSEIKGTGLGLSIVKRLCLLLNIDINIISRENEGTTVSLSFS